MPCHPLARHRFFTKSGPGSGQFLEIYTLPEYYLSEYCRMVFFVFFVYFDPVAMLLLTHLDN